MWSPGMPRSAFEAGLTHYDDSLPDRVGDLADLTAWARDDRFRFANHLGAWVDVDGDRITAAGYTGRGLVGATTVRLASMAATLEAYSLPDLQAAPETTATSARFVQTTACRLRVVAALVGPAHAVG